MAGPALGELASKALSIAFSGATGQIDHAGGALTASGRPVSEKGALRIAAVWIAVSLIADEVAGLSTRIVERGDKSRATFRPESVQPLWMRPNRDDTRFEFMAQTVLSLALWGRSVTQLGWARRGDLAELWPVDPSPETSRVVRSDSHGGLVLVTPKGDLHNIPGRRPEFMKIDLHRVAGELDAISPVRQAAELLGLSGQYERAAARLMGRGLNPSGILTSDTAIDPETAKEFSARLERLHGGADNFGKVAVIGGPNMKLQPLTMSMVDAQFLEQYERVFDVLMAIWRVPPTVAGMVDKPSTWGTGVAEFARGLERFTLRSYVLRVQDAVTTYILRESAEPNADVLQFKMIFDSLLSASPKERADIQFRRLMMGSTSQERVLAQDDEPPFEDDETTFSQLALASPEDRELSRQKTRAETARALIQAGVDPRAAFESVGLDPNLAPEAAPPLSQE